MAEPALPRAGGLVLPAHELSRLPRAIVGVLVGVVLGFNLLVDEVAQRGWAWPLWNAVAVSVLLVAALMVWTAWGRERAEPTWRVPLMGAALLLCAWAYALMGSARAAALPVAVLMATLGVASATRSQIRGLTLWALFALGLPMLWLAWTDRSGALWRVELGHFVVVAASLGGVAALGLRLARLRERSRVRRDELNLAMARIEELATHDALTGLINRRHMQTILEQERQRAVRSGHSYCVALIDLDRFRHVNAELGLADGDALLAAVAREAVAIVRAGDLLARWRGTTFLLLMPETRLAAARGALERLHEQVRRLGPEQQPPRVVSLSSGVVEHRPGESVEETLDRARGALLQAKAQQPAQPEEPESGGRASIVAFAPGVPGHAPTRSAGNGPQTAAP